MRGRPGNGPVYRDGFTRCLTKMRNIIILGLVLFVAGCATRYKSVPDGYEGLTSIIKDSAKRIDNGKVNFFYLSQVDGKEIEDSAWLSRVASSGKGSNLTIVLNENEVTSEVHKFIIIGRSTHAVPARSLVDTVYEIKGEFEFSPIPSEVYEIKGSLTEQGSTVWIEHSSSGNVIKKFEIQGSTALGVFQKM